MAATVAQRQVNQLFNQSTAGQGAGFASDTYLTGSSIAIPAGLKAGSRYRCVFSVTKTAAGTATPIVNVRFGTNGTTADTSLATLTFLAQTAATDDAIFQIYITFRSVGSGTSAVVQAEAELKHSNNSTGFSGTAGTKIVRATSSGFNSTTANSIIGISVNGGTSASWTVSTVQADLVNFN